MWDASHTFNRKPMDTKKLRQKILDLAIRGKLVPQDPNDEPASVLLERIRAEKERLVKEGKIKKSKASKTSDTPHYEQVPFEVPEGWVWTTVNTIAKSILYGVSESAKTNGKYRLLRITDIQNNSVQWDSVPYTDFDANKAESYLLSDGDILFARTGATVGKSYLVQGLKEEAIYASYLIRVQTYDAVLPQYVKFYFESGYYWEQIVQESVGVGQPNVNGTILGNLNIPIPPIHEQSRIVSELSKWMGIIDVIEQGKINLKTVIKEAKSKILDLAIHGKLVPQNPADEPASELLKRINPKAEITCDNGQYENLTFEIPNSWEWCRLGDIISIKSGDSISVRNNRDGQYPIYGGNGINGYYYDSNVDSGTIVIGRVGFYCGCVHITASKAWVTDNAFIVYYKNGLNTIYLKHLLEWLQLSKTSNSTAQPVISGKGIYPLLVPLPPLAEQQRNVDAIDKAFAKLDAIMESL